MAQHQWFPLQHTLGECLEAVVVAKPPSLSVISKLVIQDSMDVFYTQLAPMIFHDGTMYT